MPGAAWEQVRGCGNGLGDVGTGSAVGSEGQPSTTSAAPGLGTGWAWAPLAGTAHETEVAVTFRAFLCH